jgi:VWFA-related protein
LVSHRGTESTEKAWNRGRFIGIVLAAALACAAAAVLLAEQQPPPFRAGTNFVHVDVYPTAKGAIVSDLTAADFEVLEDGVPQKIETFEHVDLRGFTPEEAKAEPNSVREAAGMAETTKGRLLVIFLDTYFVNVVGSHDIRKSLVSFLNRLLGPDDMFAVMTPDMSAMDLSFARRTDTIEDNLRRFWFWGQRDRMFPDDPVEQEYLECYPDSSQLQLQGMSPQGQTGGQTQIAREMILRRREKKVIDALTDLTIHLRGVREERKAVIAITGGWVLFRENRLLTQGQTQQAVPRVGVDPTGRLTPDVSAANLGYSKSNCERDRMSLANIDDRQAVYDLYDLANRSNVSFYPVNPMGLEASGKPMGPREEDSQLVKGESDAIAPRGGTIGLAAARSDNLRGLADNTDGLAVVDTNNLDAGMKRIGADLSSYYLLGYASTNAKLDGKFRKITVRVKRAGVDVRTRRGYRAPTQKEVDEGAMAEAPATATSAPVSAIQVALDGLAPVRPGVPLRTTVSAGEVGGQLHGWLVAELDSSLFHQADWAGGAVVDIAVFTPDEIPLANKRGVITSDQRAVVVDLGELPADGATVRTKVTPQSGGLPYTDTVHLDEATSRRALLSRRGPTTGVRYVPTAVAQFGRTERVRIEVPVETGTTAASAEILDRAGKPINVPVHASTRVEGDITWATAELSLAPLGAGDYVVRLTAGNQSVVTAFHLTP